MTLIQTIKVRYCFISVVLLCVFSLFNSTTGCAQDDASFYEEMEELFIGTWRSTTVKVWVNTFENTDTSFIVYITEDTWMDMMNIEPIETTIFADGTYKSAYRDNLGRDIYQMKGVWMLNGDSLIMKDNFDEYRYKVFVDEQRLEMESMVDYDDDGKKDDRFIGTYKRKK
ncbi:MAG: hypothetical protein ACFCUU_00705 [Cyclobacteriaceae bacterium]